MAEFSQEEKTVSKEIAISADCSWLTRGFKSLFGVTCILSALSGKVLDYHVTSKYCIICARLEEGEYVDHQCSANYEGASGTMEAHATKLLFERSEEKRGLL